MMEFVEILPDEADRNKNRARYREVYDQAAKEMRENPRMWGALPVDFPSWSKCSGVRNALQMRLAKDGAVTVAARSGQIWVRLDPFRSE